MQNIVMLILIDQVTPIFYPHVERRSAAVSCSYIVIRSLLKHQAIIWENPRAGRGN